MYKPFSLAAAACLIAASANGQTGTLKGKFVFDGKAPEPAALKVDKDVEVCGQHPIKDESLVVGPDGGIANVVVYVRTKGVKVDPSIEAPATVSLDNKDCRFEPHVVGVWAGKQKLLLGNSDSIGHNSNIQPPGDTPANPLLAPMKTQEFSFRRAQNVGVPVTCNIHPWMKGWVIVRDNPYFAISGADGSFEIKGLPPGELEFQVWHEKAGYVDVPSLKWDKGRFKTKIAAGDNTIGADGVVKLDPKIFQK